MLVILLLKYQEVARLNPQAVLSMLLMRFLSDYHYLWSLQVFADFSVQRVRN